MGIFDRFRGSRGPTEEWRAQHRLLVVDLDALEFCGVGFGGPIDRLSFLGPSESKWYDYHRKGLSLDVEDGRFRGVQVALRDDAFLGTASKEPVLSFPGRIRMAGSDYKPSELTSEDDFVSALGEPYWREEDEVEVVLYYEISENGAEIQVEITDEGPQVVLFSDEPLMADPEQRALQGVDRPWPPDS
ncbi:MAG: hypothetical protein GWM92_10750 [Gemmatimonadetes bacterium]|nr:hypothetical protein [Gemmatimonadota bacterium]NIR79175.1 hypothetical protein [Gemmatimonadota bacterium]NIT87830.1 hypothetical protein [Gemmatimonadota bacterium]NIU31691.1 hypothetical protein [Gemmatimonadota bacterium]NIU36310.1 hypothetical protein [Gemmatimonadota bacterium]